MRWDAGDVPSTGPETQGFTFVQRYFKELGHVIVEAGPSKTCRPPTGKAGATVEGPAQPGGRIPTFLEEASFFSLKPFSRFNRAHPCHGG